MRRCEFPLAPTTLSRKNEHLGIKKTNNGYSFNLNGIQLNGVINTNTKYRIVLQHKISGETKIFYNSETVTFTSEIEKLASKETGSNLGDSYAELTRQYGSVKAQKQLREKEKLSINKEAQKTLKVAHRDALKDEKTEAAKGNKLEKMDCNLDGSFSAATLSSLIDSERRIKLSNIAPKEVLDALESEAESVIGLSYEQIENLKSNLAFQSCILEILKKLPSYDLRTMKLCILLEYMIRFSGLTIVKARSKEPLYGCNATVMHFIISNYTKEVFSESGKSTLHSNKDEKDKLCLMIIALYGYLSNYNFPISRFMVDIKAGRDRIKKLGLLIDMTIRLQDKEHVMVAKRPYIIDDLS